jgi:DNA-binding NarL/FixJ family response regulator
MIRIVLVDDQTLVRQGIRSLLELVADLSIVAEASDGDEAVTVIQRENPDVVLLDLRMPKKGGVEVLRELRGSSTLPPTIVLTTFDDDEALLDAVRAGAKGYFLKDVSLERLTDGIREVARGGSIIRPAITERVLKGLEHVRRDFDALSPPDPLTKREVEILRLMAGGYSNREIAEALGTAEGTVKNHASSILSKLGVRDRTRAVLKALELGYISALGSRLSALGSRLSAFDPGSRIPDPEIPSPGSRYRDRSWRYVSFSPSVESHEISDIAVMYTVMRDELPVALKRAAAIAGESAPPRIVPSVRLSDAPL